MYVVTLVSSLSGWKSWRRLALASSANESVPRCTLVAVLVGPRSLAGGSSPIASVASVGSNSAQRLESRPAYLTSGGDLLVLDGAGTFREMDAWGVFVFRDRGMHGNPSWRHQLQGKAPPNPPLIPPPPRSIVSCFG